MPDGPIRRFLFCRGGDRRRRGEGEREGGERLRAAEGPGEYEVPGGGVGSRTADESTSAISNAGDMPRFFPLLVIYHNHIAELNDEYLAKEVEGKSLPKKIFAKARCRSFRATFLRPQTRFQHHFHHRDRSVQQSSRDRLRAADHRPAISAHY